MSGLLTINPGAGENEADAVKFITPRSSIYMTHSSVTGPDSPYRELYPGFVIVMEDQMKGYFALALLPWLIGTALADVQPPPTLDAQKQPRILGQKAVLHVYYYSPKTLEITYVDSYLFKDQEACMNAIGSALQIAMPYAGDGDLVTAKCVGVNPPDAITKPDKKRDTRDSTEL
jgi:hypothetical protein